MSGTVTDDPKAVGEEFARALAAKDFDRAAEVLDTNVDFRALTPNRNWHATSPDDVVRDVLREWLEDSDEAEGMIAFETGSFADREHMAYSFRVRNGKGPLVVEQQAYFTTRDGRIDWIRILCSGMRPAGSAG